MGDVTQSTAPSSPSMSPRLRSTTSPDVPLSHSAQSTRGLLRCGQVFPVSAQGPSYLPWTLPNVVSRPRVSCKDRWAGSVTQHRTVVDNLRQPSVAVTLGVVGVGRVVRYYNTVLLPYPRRFFKGSVDFYNLNSDTPDASSGPRRVYLTEPKLISGKRREREKKN